MFDKKPAICRICKEGCGLLVSRSSSGMKITGNPDHPVSRGFACFRATHFGAVQDSPERLTTPLVKTKTGWQPIPYPDAIALLAEKIKTAQQAHGAETFAVYKGESLKHQENTGYLRHLCFGLGSPNYHSVSSICHSALALGHGLTYGGIPVPDYPRLRSILVWGCNPANAFQRSFVRLKEAKDNGVKIVVVDPTRTATAKIADLHLPIRPGTDGFLALAFLKMCAADGRFEPDPASSVGWPQLSEELASLSLEFLLEQTGLSSALFARAVELMLHNSPAWIETGLGLELQPQGVQTVRAIACLQAVLDPLARPALPWGKLTPLPGSDRYREMSAPVGGEDFPIFAGRIGEGQMMSLPDAILGSRQTVRTMLIAGANPMMTFPDPTLFGRVLARLDFLAVFDLFMTKTAERADLVLPAASFLEFHELHDYVTMGQPHLGLIRPVEDEGLGWPLWKLVFELAKAMDVPHLFPWQNNREAIAARMAGSGIEFADLENSPTLTVPYAAPPVTPGVWRTVDGKVHFHSAALEIAGQSGIPAASCFVPTLPDTTEFPFHLSTGDRISVFQHSQFRNIPAYSDKGCGPNLAVHPAAARELGIEAGETVTLATPFGSLEVAVSLAEELRPDCLRLAHGWREANANRLGGFTRLDPISGFPWLKALPARIDRKQPA